MLNQHQSQKIKDYDTQSIIVILSKHCREEDQNISIKEGQEILFTLCLKVFTIPTYTIIKIILWTNFIFNAHIQFHNSSNNNYIMNPFQIDSISSTTF